MRVQSERGVALILALFLTAALSVLAASLMFLSQTETYASMNYRMMSQARYAAEAGVQKAANHLLASYTPPSDVGVDLLTLYDYSVSPVLSLANNQPVVLSAKDADCSGSNYPIAAVQDAFCAAAKDLLTAGNAQVTYNATATLMAMQTFTSYGGELAVVQTWQIVGSGGLTGARPATVEVMATIETPKMMANSYSAFATDAGCGALTIGGSPTTDSYSSATLSGTTMPTLTGEGGDVGTNGNIEVNTNQQITVQGHLYTPRSGVGACVDGVNVTALTQSGQADVSGSLVQLPKALPYPPPTIPAPSVLAGLTDPTCLLLGLTSGTSKDDVVTGPATSQCFLDGDVMTINGHGVTLSLPSISMTGNRALYFVAAGPLPISPATYNVNSLSESGNATVGVIPTATGQSVVVNIVGKNPDGSDIATPLDLSGGSYAAPDLSYCAACSAYDASMLQFVYGGSGLIKLTGNSTSAAVFYAPNAAIEVSGNTAIYGSVLGKTIVIEGNSNIYYDSSLQGKFFVPGSPVIGTFTWKRF